MTVVVTVCLGIVAVAAVLCVAKLLYAESFADRVVALDLLLGVVVTGTALIAVGPGPDALLNLPVIFALLGFVGTVTVARFLEGRGL